jgi:hypothetical protein
LRGALSGILGGASSSSTTNTDKEERGVLLSISVATVLSQFLLPYIGPIDIANSHEHNDDLDEDAIRDAALQTLIVLFQIPVRFEQSNNQKQDGEWSSYIEWIISTAQQGVRYRSTERDMLRKDDDDENDPQSVDDAGMPSPWNHPTDDDYRRGLSVLPRSRRSLCFELLSVAVQAMQKLLPTPTPSSVASILESIRSFVRFVAHCLHGESDPRCLLQLLQLLDTILESNPFRSFVQNATVVSFPVSDVFDAVAPYYPVQFTPPPNDIHHITRDQLRQAVWRVLSNTRYDNNDDEDSNMLHLGLHLILESIELPPEDGPIQFIDQHEMLQDLDEFLFRTMDDRTNWERLNYTQAEQIACVLERVHEKTSLAVADSQDVVHSKPLADFCRQLLAKMALAVEGNVDLWTAFVTVPVRRMAELLATNDVGNSTSGRRVAIAYLAGLAASGGAKTLQVTLAASLPAMLQALKNDADDTIALYGIAAFFSSAQVAMDKAYAAHKIRIHPHPLASYGPEAVNLICSLVATDTADERPAEVYAAAIRAMETILMTTPATAFTAEKVDVILQFLKQMAARIVIPSKKDGEIKTYQNDDVLQASAQTLGTCLGQVMRQENGSMEISDESTRTVLHEEKLVNFLKSDIFSSLLSSVKLSVTSSLVRYDRKTLANAACVEKQAAVQIVQPLVESLYDAILTNEDESANAISATLSFLFQNSNGLAGLAFQELEAPAKTFLDILNALGPSALNGNNDNLETDLGMSALRIPVCSEEPEKINTVVGKAYDQVMQLRYAYKYGVTTKHLDSLVRAVDYVLPPLSFADAVKLSILFPILAAAMQSYEPGNPVATDENYIQETLASMASDLVDFALNSDNHPIARSHAGLCLHASISKASFRDLQECPAQSILKNKLIPSFKTIFDSRNDTSACDFADCLNIITILGSAAACRGGTSSKTADQIMLFLVDLSCTKKARCENYTVDLTIFDSNDFNFSEELSIKAASAVGTILETEHGSTLWKQRLTHISVRHIVECISDINTSDDKVTKEVSLGTLAAMCHLVCFSNLQHILVNRLKAIARLLTYGLSSIAIDSALKQNHQIIKLILASLVKMLSMAPSSFGDNIYPLVTGTMRAFASADAMDHNAEISCKLLAMEALQAIAQMHHVPDTLRKLQPAVVSILGAAMNSPLSTVRQAAVQVRNVWYLID